MRSSRRAAWLPAATFVVAATLAGWPSLAAAQDDDGSLPSATP